MIFVYQNSTKSTMKKKKIDRIIEAFRRHKNLLEQMGGGMMTTSSSEGKPGFSGKSDPKGPTAGFDPLISTAPRKGAQIKLPPGSRKRWMK